MYYNVALIAIGIILCLLEFNTLNKHKKSYNENKWKPYNVRSEYERNINSSRISIVIIVCVILCVIFLI